jgi:hypothetical protein
MAPVEGQVAEDLGRPPPQPGHQVLAGALRPVQNTALGQLGLGRTPPELQGRPQRGRLGRAYALEGKDLCQRHAGQAGHAAGRFQQDRCQCQNIPVRGSGSQQDRHQLRR